MLRKFILLLFLVSGALYLQSSYAESDLPCTFSYKKFPTLCLHIIHNDMLKTPVKSDEFNTGGRVYFYFWQQGQKHTQNITDRYDVQTSIVMPEMLQSNVCFVGQFYNQKWTKGCASDEYWNACHAYQNFTRLQGDTMSQSGLYRVEAKVRIKGSNDPYQTMERLLDNSAIPHDHEKFDPWVYRFTHHFLVPQQQ